MPQIALPRPSTLRPLSAIHPARVRSAYVELLGVIYHAEVAALDAFQRLSDPEMVVPCETLLRARPMLIRDEQAHLEDIEEMVRVLGADQLPPEHPAFTDLWNVERARQRLLYPLPPYLAAMFILAMESLGYVILFHLAEHTTDEAIASRLAANVRDEQRHLRASIHGLSRTLGSGAQRAAALADMTVHLLAFGVLVRGAGQYMKRIVEGVGWDPAILGASAIQFTASLFGQALGKSPHRAASSTTLSPIVARTLLSPNLVRALEPMTRIPAPAVLWPVLRVTAAQLRRGRAYA